MVSVGHLTCHGMKGIGQKPDESVPDAIKPRPGDVMCDSGAGLWLFQTVRGSSVLCVLDYFLVWRPHLDVFHFGSWRICN